MAKGSVKSGLSRSRLWAARQKAGQYLVDGVDAAGVEQDALSERGLARVNVGGDADVAEVAQLAGLVLHLCRLCSKAPAQSEACRPALQAPCCNPCQCAKLPACDKATLALLCCTRPCWVILGNSSAGQAGRTAGAQPTWSGHCCRWPHCCWCWPSAPTAPAPPGSRPGPALPAGCCHHRCAVPGPAGAGLAAAAPSAPVLSYSVICLLFARSMLPAVVLQCLLWDLCGATELRRHSSPWHRLVKPVLSGLYAQPRAPTACCQPKISDRPADLRLQAAPAAACRAGDQQVPLAAAYGPLGRCLAAIL